MSILISKLPLQQGDSPRKSHPTQMGCSSISSVGYTKMLLVSQCSVRSTVAQSGNTGWSSLKCGLPSKNTSQSSVIYISCQLPVCLVRFHANFVYFCCHSHRKMLLQLLGVDLLLIGTGHPSTDHWAVFENAALWFKCSRVIFRSGLAAQIPQIPYGAGTRLCVRERGRALRKCCTGAAVEPRERRAGTGRESWWDCP